MAELGESADPRALVPGDPEAARATARSMTAYAGNLHEAGAGLARIASPDGWAGDSADRFRERFAVQPPAWNTAGDAFTEASRTLDIYAETLAWAQLQAADAAGRWNDAAPAVSGDAERQVAQDVLQQARTQLAAAGDAAASALERLAEAAPTAPSFWGDVGDVLGEIGDGALDVGRDIVNATASVGNAALHHPGEVATMATGLGLVGLGLGGEFGGAALDLSVVGAPAGVTVNIASAGLIAAGAGMAGAGAMSVAQSAAGDDRVEPLQPGGGDPPTPATRPAAQQPTVENPQLGNIVNDLYRGTRTTNRVGDGTTADAARIERAGGPRVEGRDHIRKANIYIRGLRNWLRRNPNASAADRGIAQNELQNLLDALGRT